MKIFVENNMENESVSSEVKLWHIYKQNSVNLFD